MFVIDLLRHLKNGNHLSMEMIYYVCDSRLHKTISYRIQTVCRPRRNTIGAYLWLAWRCIQSLTDNRCTTPEIPITKPMRGNGHRSVSNLREHKNKPLLTPLVASKMTLK